LLVALPVFVGAAAYAQLAPPQYTAKAIVALEPRAAVNVGPPDMPILGQKYVAYATSSTTIAQVARAAGVPAQTLAGAVQAKVPVQSVDFVITVTLRSPIAAAVAANDLADAVVRLTRSDTLVSGQVVAPAARPTTPSAPRRKLIEAAGLLLALFIGVVVSTLVERGRPRIRSALEVAYVTGHAVIGRVPRSRALRRGMGQAIADPLLG
ncbi:MAG: YveK family protein, partial [Mycobacteriales bacterium]